MLEKHQKAPLFSSKNQFNETVNLSDYLGKKNVVLYFYPKDDTPGCTIEANQFTQLAGEFAKADTVIIGVSKDSCASHTDFIKKFDLKVDLLADVDGELCESYGVWQEREKMALKAWRFFVPPSLLIKKAYWSMPRMASRPRDMPRTYWTK